LAVATIGLVLTGGGARAAYQAGALRALGRILAQRESPFGVLAGVSAGAVNCVLLGAYSDDFRSGVAALVDTWKSLTPDRVYRTDTRSLASIGGRFLASTASGGLFGTGPVALLDTSPLGHLLEDRLPLERLEAHYASGRLRGLAVSATNYATGTAITFFDGARDIEPWLRSTRIGVREAIDYRHVMASSAIPIFFPPVELGGVFFGDGCIRMNAPLSPAIHLGADRIIAIGIRYFRSHHETLTLNRITHQEVISLSDIGGVLLNAVFLDSLETDIERAERINATLGILPPELLHQLPLRPVPVLTLRPSQDLGRLAARQHQRFPMALRGLLRGVGVTGDGGRDLLSYIAFEPQYIETLMQLGEDDTLARRQEIEDFVG
jgi:NTE family protein